jgi:hypothetical protein
VAETFGGFGGADDRLEEWEAEMRRGSVLMGFEALETTGSVTVVGGAPRSLRQGAAWPATAAARDVVESVPDSAGLAIVLPEVLSNRRLMDGTGIVSRMIQVLRLAG